MQPKIIVSSTKQEALHESAKLFVSVVNQASNGNERVTVALSGGSTPKGLFELLSDQKLPYYSKVDWKKIHFFWSDERFVPPTDKDSNFLMAKLSLLDRIPIEPSQIHRLMTEKLGPEECAQAYQKEIQEFFGKRDLNQPPAFDLMLLGMGPDGHTASLFPDAPLGEIIDGPFNECWVKSFFVPHLKDDQPMRITFTPKLINASKVVVFLVLGKDKAEAFHRVMQSNEPETSVPAKLIQPKSGVLYWLIDQEVSSSKKIAS